MTTPNPEAAVMSGGPGVAAQPAAVAAAPELVEIDLAGTKVKVEKTVADGIKAAQAAAVEQAREEAAEEARLAAEAGRPHAPAKPATAVDDPLANADTELFADPKAFVQKLRTTIANEIKTDLTAQYQAEQMRSAFWSEFYSANKDLADEKMIVDAVFRRDASKLLNIRADKAAEKLAAAAKVELLRLKGTQPGPGGTPVAEGGNQPGNLSKTRQSKPSETDVKGPRSLTQIINERRAARAPGAKRQQAA